MGGMEEVGRRFIVVGRHSFTSYQEELLRKAGLTEEVGRVVTVSDVRAVVQEAKEKGAGAIVVQALPPHLLAQLFAEAKKAGLDIYIFEMDYANAKVFSSEAEVPEELRKVSVLVPSRDGNIRVVPVKGLKRVTNVVFKVEGDLVAP